LSSLPQLQPIFSSLSQFLFNIFPVFPFFD
jgi:hypothetical protein